MFRRALKYSGRFLEPPVTANLVETEEDYLGFESFKDIPLLRGPDLGTGISVLGVDMCLQTNMSAHNTHLYECDNLVVRRGQEFIIRVTFSRPMEQNDDVQLEFLIGSSPASNKETKVVVTFGSRPGSSWAGRIVESQGDTTTFGITPTPNAIVGKFRTYVGIGSGSGVHRTQRDTSTDLYLLFNAWCSEDHVFYPDESGRANYVLSDYGSIFQGSVGAVSQRSWMYGQFERGVLDACIYILDASHMPISDRSNAIKLVRKGSAMLNSQDDNGVLVGNWGESFAGGSPPTLWTGSVRILLQYANTGIPVSYAQCWVYAGVFNTFLRCLGIPSRVITNFNSAHDNTGNLKTDLIFQPDGTPDRRNTRDSIWNYHCWNEVYMVRTDLPPELGGWQVVDSTPQETSDGHFRCGPASVKAIKDGRLCYPFDAGFVFAEVNSDVVYMKRDRYGVTTPYKVDTTYIGQLIYTEAPGTGMAQDITHTYKYPEGSAQDEETMRTAEAFGCERDHSELTEGDVDITISNDPVNMAQDVTLLVDLSNKSSASVTAECNLAVSVNYYTGVLAKAFKEKKFTVTIPGNQTERMVLSVTAEEYMAHLGSQRCLNACITGEANNQQLSTIKAVVLNVPSISVEVSKKPQVKQEVYVTATFTNPFDYPLYNVNFAMEGPKLLTHRTRFFRMIEASATITWKESFVPQVLGPRRILVLMDCSILREVSGVCDFVIEP